MKKILITLLLSTILFTSFSQDVIEPNDLSKTFIKVKEPQQYDGYVVNDPKMLVVIFYRVNKDGRLYLVGRKIVNTIIWDKLYILSNKKVKLKNP